MDLSEFGKILSVPSRVSILNALMSGEALPAGELAYRSGVSSQTMSEHLALLEKHQMISARKCGRHRYYELANENAAMLLEALGEFVPNISTKKFSGVPDRMCEARFCYKHLAGRLGVTVTNRLVEKNALNVQGRQYVFTPLCSAVLAEVGIDISGFQKGHVGNVRQCLDWTERRPHVAGAFGSALAERFLELGWIRRHRDDRSAIVTDVGRAGFHDWLGVGINENPRLTTST
jgi:DNA-binding transcriptional ArsR family regulator